MTRVYLGSYTGEGGPGLGIGTADPETGALTVERWLGERVPDPSWLALSPGGRALYAVSEGDPVGAVRGLDAETLEPLGEAQPVGSAPAHTVVDPSGRYLLTSLYGGGAVVVHPLGDDGSVGPASGLAEHGPGTAHAHQAVADPSGRFVLSVDLGLDAVLVSELGEGTLRELSRARFEPGSGPRHLAFHPSGDYAYVAGELGSTVTVCSWRDGELVPGAVHPATSAQVTNHPGEITVTSDGRFAHVGNRGDNTIAVFATSGGGATISLTATADCGGDWPRHHAIDPSGRWLYVANQRSGDVTWFPLDPSTGVPGPAAGRIAVPGAAHVLFA
ncbi:MAG: hypothetical protein JWO79_3130 [Actinomycetia bacterium]|nr:hypothetical protein [Actinomycetes bacterium]